MGEIETVQQATEVARGISEYGMLAITAGFYLVLSAIMMVAIFKWFKSIINQMLEQQGEAMEQMSEMQSEGNKMLKVISEGMRTETQLRIRNLTGFAFDLAVEQVCKVIKDTREQNHIAERERTQQKIRRRLQVIHDDRKSRFDVFHYEGHPLGDYCNPEWVEMAAKVVEDEIYSEDGPNDSRAHSNVELLYNNIKTDMYKRLKQ